MVIKQSTKRYSVLILIAIITGYAYFNIGIWSAISVIYTSIVTMMVWSDFYEMSFTYKVKDMPASFNDLNYLGTKNYAGVSAIFLAIFIIGELLERNILPWQMWIITIPGALIFPVYHIIYFLRWLAERK